MISLSRGPYVLDGGFSSQLERDGVQIKGDPLWGAKALITAPAKVIEIHKRYLNAGAQIIETDTYQAAIPTLQEVLDGCSLQKAQLIVGDSVRLARQAIAEFCKEHNRKTEDYLIAGSIGPFATVLYDGSEYYGNYVNSTPREDIISYFRDQMTVLVEAGVDLIAFETVPSLSEAKIILEVLESSPPVFAWISFTCRDAISTAGGDRFADVVSTLSASGAVSMIGINCTAPDYVASLLDCGAHSTKQFVVYPNSGGQWQHDNGWMNAKEPTALSTLVPEWVARGANVIGGCCRIGPDGIREIAKAVANLRARVNTIGQ